MSTVVSIPFGYLPKTSNDNKENSKQTSSEYIREIETLRSDEIKPIALNKFIKEIDKEYGETNRKDTFAYLYTQNEKCHSGWKDFMTRVDKSFDGENLSGADQKYIADVTHRISLKILKS